MKTYYVQYGVGRAKYVVNHHDGEKKHTDGSDFFDVTIFSSKKKLDQFLSELQSKGYIVKGVSIWERA